MKNLVLKDRIGQIIRVFRCETEKVCLVYRKRKGRLDLCSSPDFFEEDSVILIEKWEVSKMKNSWPVPFISGVLEICDEVSGPRGSLSRKNFNTENLWKIFFFVLGIYMIFIGGLYGLSQFSQTKEEKTAQQRVVQIIKPPAVVQPEKVIVGSKQMFIRSSTDTVKKKVLKRSLKKMGALSALGSLSKEDTQQRSGLNLGSSQVSAGPGFRAVASLSGSGGVQDSLYSQGMITSALGSGGNIRGGGGHGTKGREQGGGLAGYGKLSLIGSGGTEDLSSSSVLDSQGGKFDFGIIDREIIRKVGKIRKCYNTALRTEPDIKGLFKIYFVIGPNGQVLSSNRHPSSPVRSEKVSSCVLDIIRQIEFPIQLMAAVGINYKFDLSVLGKGGGE